MEQTKQKNGPCLARIRAKKDGQGIITYLSDRRKIVVEKSALAPAGATNIRWQDARVTSCGVGIIPAKPNDIRFIATDILALMDPDFAEAYIKQRFQNAARWAPFLKKYRKQCQLSFGEAAQLSGIDGFAIMRMEAGYPMFPLTAMFKVLFSYFRELWRRQGRTV